MDWQIKKKKNFLKFCESLEQNTIIKELGTCDII